MTMSYHQNLGQYLNLLIANKSSKNMTKLKHLGTTVTNQNCIYETIKSTLNSGNASYRSVQSLFLPSLL
jgi:hypothetical protein